MELLYYFGILQKLINSFGSLMANVTGFGPLECFVSAANIFLGAVSITKGLSVYKATMLISLF